MHVGFGPSHFILLISFHHLGISSSLLSVGKRDKFHALHLKHQDIYDDATNPTNIWGRKDESEENSILDFTEDPKNLRLPLEVIPFHYFLKITPILEENTGLGKRWTAPGSVKILVKAVKPTRTITLNSVRLEILKVVVVNRSNGKSVTVAKHAQSKLRYDQYVITLGQELVVENRYEISIEFVAPVSRSDPDGLYRSEYFDPETEKVSYLASTQMEFFSARQVFPCLDQPNLKTKFDIDIGRSSNFHSLSNSNLISTIPLKGFPGWFIDSFNTTVKMPTYLVAFVVSNFTFSEADSTILTGRPVRVYGPKYSMDQGAGVFGANVTARVLSFFENYFDLEYPLPKMDAVAVPGFLYGNIPMGKTIILFYIYPDLQIHAVLVLKAMENYGLNIYKESLLLNIPGVATQQQLSRSSNVIAHETAHQYFGNLVTCKWWDNIWLNEGFATYYSYVGQNFTNPEFEPMKQFVLEGLQLAMALDSREGTSYPLLLTAKTHSQFEDQVTGLPYYKGASLIHMMQGFLTPKTFHKGINRYLKTWAYNTTEQDNLFEALTEAGREDGTLPADMTVKEIMEPWTKQSGYPLVRVISNEDTLYILYEQCKSQTDDRKKHHTSWTIPVSYATEDEPDFLNHVPKFWIPEGSVMRTLKHNTSKWIVINPETTGFYRVVYDKKLTQLLHNQFNADHNVISALTRSQILDDYFALGNQMDIPISMALDFTKYLGKETEDICWSVVFKYFRRMYYFYSEMESKSDDGIKISATKHFKGFRNYFVPRLEEVLDKIGFEQLPNEMGSKVIFRARLLNWACRLGSQKCLDYANRLLELWKYNEQENPIPNDLRDFMYCYGVAVEGVSNWLFALDRSANTTNVKDALLLVHSLGCIKDKAILKSVLQSTLMDAEIDKHSLGTLIDATANNPLGRPVLMQFLKENIPKMKKQLNNTFDPIIYRAFLKLGSYLHTEEELLELQNIIELHSNTFGELLSVVSSSVSDVGRNIVWISKHYKPMQAWFDAQNPSSTL